MAKPLNIGDLVQRVRAYNTFEEDGWIEITDKKVLGIVIDVEYADPVFGTAEISSSAFIKVAWQDTQHDAIWCFIEELKLYKKHNKTS